MDMNELNLAEHFLADGNYLLRCDLLEASGIKTLEDSLDVYPEYMLLSSEAKFLNRIHHIPQVLWSIGGDDGKKITLCTEREGDDIYNLISAVGCENPEDNATLMYLATHSITDIFYGKNPDFVPYSVRIVEGGSGIIEMNFTVAEELKASGVKGKILLNRVDDAKIIVNDASWPPAWRHVVGYTASAKQEPYVETSYCFERTKCKMTFEVESFV